MYAYIRVRGRKGSGNSGGKSTGTGLNGVPCCVARPRVPSPHGGRRIRPLPKCTGRTFIAQQNHRQTAASSYSSVKYTVPKKKTYCLRTLRDCWLAAAFPSSCIRVSSHQQYILDELYIPIAYCCIKPVHYIRIYTTYLELLRIFFHTPHNYWSLHCGRGLDHRSLR